MINPSYLNPNWLHLRNFLPLKVSSLNHSFTKQWWSSRRKSISMCLHRPERRPVSPSPGTPVLSQLSLISYPFYPFPFPSRFQPIIITWISDCVTGAWCIVTGTTTGVCTCGFTRRAPESCCFSTVAIAGSGISQLPGMSRPENPPFFLQCNNYYLITIYY